MGTIDETCFLVGPMRTDPGTSQEAGASEALPRPLTGLRVIDLTHHVAGPYCTKLLADFGADVIKVERPGVGDAARRTGPFAQDIPGLERSLLFQHLNTGKRSVTVNLRSSAGVEIFRRLVGTAHILVENFAPRVMPALGLGADSLLAEHPSLVMVSISNFGQTGPYRDLPATHLTEYALGGSMYIIGYKDREPLQGPGRQAEYVAGLFAVLGALGAYTHASATGQGQHVDVSILEAVASIQENTTSTWAYTGDIWRRDGSRRLPYPMTILPCRDGHIGVNAVTEQQWELMLALMDRLDLQEDPRFANGQTRLDYADDLDRELTKWLIERDKEEIYHAAQSYRVPFGRVSTTTDLLSNGHLKAREYFREVNHPVVGSMTLPGAPFRLPESPHRLARAPLLGEHTPEVLKEIGLTTADVERLTAMGVV